jgi:DNA polymerase II small subunit/DNA polymerase delta subunit B
MNVAAMPLQTPASDNEHEVRVRTLFLSDIHLGSRGCRAGRLLDFLRGHEADTVYLVGDIVDGWHLKSGWYWPQDHNDVVQKLLRQARKGTRVIYVSSCAGSMAPISAASKSFARRSMSARTVAGT